MLKSIIYELKPTAEQRSHIRRACGSARYVYNKALALKKEKYEKEKVNLSKYDIDKMLTIWKQTDTFLSECPSQSLQQKVHDMCDAKTMVVPKIIEILKMEASDDTSANAS